MITRFRRLAVGAILSLLVFAPVPSVLAATSQNGSVGLEARVPADPPTTGATISVPSNGQRITSLPLTVRGICPTGLLVKLFRNNVFGGSADCVNGSFEIVADLFSGQNELVARVYDSLDQAGPDSNTVTVNFDDADFGTFIIPVSLTSNFAKRGANPGETLTWPIQLSGGTGPYAFSIDWGDGSTNDLKSQEFPGSVTLEHTYASAGIYRILVKVTDKNGSTAYLQLVGVANGTPGQSNDTTSDNTRTITKVQVVWWPSVAMFPLLFTSFWLGKRHELYVLRKQLESTGRS